MNSFSVREAAPLSRTLADAGLAYVIDCTVCHAFTRSNLIQLHELCRSSLKCPGCYFLHTILLLLQEAGFETASGPWTPLVLTSWNLWGDEHFLTIARCTTQPWAEWQVPTILEEADFFEVFKTPGEQCPWARLPTAKLISGYTGSRACLTLLRDRIDECVQKHSSCRDTFNVALPTRLLQIYTTEGNDEDIRVRLVEPNQATGRYVCLSHRWIEGQTITTTTANIDQRRAGISWEELPKTFQEAIAVTFTLGFEYIWIDCLAINQDPSSGDWLAEAPKMVQYYQNAFLTISAAEATGGLFHELAKPGQITWKVEPPSQFKQPCYNVCVRKPLSHDASALHERGWVFQEHLLSPRTAHFAKELIWECAETAACECGKLPIRSQGGQNGVRDPWNVGRLVSTYGRKQGHLMALSSKPRPPGFYLQPQPVFYNYGPQPTDQSVQCSHWVMHQRRRGGHQVEKDDSVAERPDKANVIPRDSPTSDIDELGRCLTILSTGGVRREDRGKMEKGDGMGASPFEKPRDGQSGEIEASEDVCTTTTPPTADGNVREKPRIQVSQPTPLVHCRWLDMVAHYTRRKLTYGSDVFPALSGLAKQFQERLGCDYYAGLWEATFVIDLLWRTRYPEKHTRPKEWHAPSWSWASSSAAVDYYHLLMAFELDSHTFRYSFSHVFITGVRVECVPKHGDDVTMGLISAEVSLEGVLFQLVFPTVSVDPGRKKQLNDEVASAEALGADQDLKEDMQQGVCVPQLAIPEDDIRYFPLSRYMNRVEESCWLCADTGLDIKIIKQEAELRRQAMEIWWDHDLEAEDRESLLSGKEKVYDLLLVARHESTLDTACYSLILKRTEKHLVFERLGLLRHERLFASGLQAMTRITLI